MNNECMLTITLRGRGWARRTIEAIGAGKGDYTLAFGHSHIKPRHVSLRQGPDCVFVSLCLIATRSLLPLPQFFLLRQMRQRNKRADGSEVEMYTW